MDQLSFIQEDSISFPLTYDDLDLLYRKYIYEGETDDDVFTCSEIQNGRSYYMYGQKVFEFVPGESKKARLKILKASDSKPLTLKPDISPGQLLEALEMLKSAKRKIFRNTITEEFACCHDFKNCSAVDACIHQEDRFYNGCLYRKNLEAGKNFYKE